VVEPVCDWVVPTTVSVGPVFSNAVPPAVLDEPVEELVDVAPAVVLAPAVEAVAPAPEAVVPEEDTVVPPVVWLAVSEPVVEDETPAPAEPAVLVVLELPLVTTLAPPPALNDEVYCVLCASLRCSVARPLRKVEFAGALMLLMAACTWRPAEDGTK
jgi:hypothetical protein